MQFKYLNILGMGMGLSIKNFRVLGMGLGLGIKNFWVLGFGYGFGYYTQTHTQNMYRADVLGETSALYMVYVLYMIRYEPLKDLLYYLRVSTHQTSDKY